MIDYNRLALQVKNRATLGFVAEAGRLIEDAVREECERINAELKATRAILKRERAERAARMEKEAHGGT